MITVHSISALREIITQQRQQGRRIGFVPTMGNLHDGHISLIHQATRNADFTVASIFVNPLQFGVNEDLDSYPRTLIADSERLELAGCHCLFAPSVEEMYPDGQGSKTRVSVTELSTRHCGASRPGHFEGVATVVTKLFGIAQPDIAVFGQKDFQQLAVIRQLTRDLCFPIEIIGIPTARAASGLALSSRNGYLSSAELSRAPQLYRTLQGVAEQLQEDRQHNFTEMEERANCTLEQAGFTRDYVHICEATGLQPAKPDDDHLVILAAAKLGNTRLIDNIEIRR